MDLGKFEKYLLQLDDVMLKENGEGSSKDQRKGRGLFVEQVTGDSRLVS